MSDTGKKKTIRLLAVSGSLRRGSYNTSLLHEAIRLFGECEAEFADLNLPLFNADLEELGQPAPVERLIAQIRAADAVLFATPEYNKMIPGVLKNALDWISRYKPVALTQKPVVLISTAGRSGGEVSQLTMRHALFAFDVALMHSTYIVPFAAKSFDEDRRLIDPAREKSLATLMARLRDSLKD